MLNAPDVLQKSSSINTNADIFISYYFFFYFYLYFGINSHSLCFIKCGYVIVKLYPLLYASFTVLSSVLCKKHE